MISRFKNLFTKSKPSDAKFVRKLDALLCRCYRSSSSQSINPNKSREIQWANSAGDEVVDGKINSRRVVQIQVSVDQETSHSSGPYSSCDPPQHEIPQSQPLPLLIISPNAEQDPEIQQPSDSPRSPSPIASSQGDSSSDSQSSDSHYFDNVTLSHNSLGSSEKLDNPEIGEALGGLIYPGGCHLTSSGNAPTSEKVPKVQHPNNLMNALSSHEIEWAAMMELQKADHSGILRGLTSRQIRWLVREGRCKTWLVGTEGPLKEEGRAEMPELQSPDCTVL